MNEKILVIGGTGMLGTPVAKKLNEAGFRVRLMVRSIPKAKEQFSGDFDIVNGNIYSIHSLEKAMQNCWGVHINLSGEQELIGVENIVSAAKYTGIKRISYISGTSVAKENTWVPIIHDKYHAEEVIRKSGIAYTIFCPTWFMEVIPKYFRDGKAVVFGKQPNPYHFIAADDYARMVAESYKRDDAINKRFVIHGPDGILFTEAINKYRLSNHPEIKKVMNMPFWLATIISKLKHRPEMKAISDWMKAFEKIGEKGNPVEANIILGAPTITLEKWIFQQTDKHLNK